MKKKILFAIISFFLFMPNTFALAKINSTTIIATMDGAGNTVISESWEINDPDDYQFEKKFANLNKENIKNIQLVDSSGVELAKVDKYDEKKYLSYAIEDKEDTKVIKFNTEGKPTTIIISYSIENMIKEFEDLNAIDWIFVEGNKKQEFGILNIYIKGPVKLTENNTASYLIGDNLSCNLANGEIHIFSSKVGVNNRVRFLASFIDIPFTSTTKMKGTFITYYNKVSKESPISKEFMNFLKKGIIFIIAIGLIIFLIISFIIKKVRKLSLYQGYNDIISYNKQRSVGDLNSVAYNDEIPCEGDIYKIYFIANYYNIIKHHSTLVASIMFKWIVEGILRIESTEEKTYIVIEDNKVFTRELDNRLYNILKNAADNLILDNNKLIRYCEEHNEEIMLWYNDAIKESIKDEYIKRNINIKGKKILLTKIIHNEAIKIQGLKRYLLNFNQVPRKIALTEDIYKYSLALAVLFGVDENLYQEILRKNPDNELALKLQEFAKVKYIYRNLYSTVFEAYKKNKNKSVKLSYHPNN